MCQYDPKSALALYDFSCTQILEKISVRILVLKYSKKNIHFSSVKWASKVGKKVFLRKLKDTSAPFNTVCVVGCTAFRGGRCVVSRMHRGRATYHPVIQRSRHALSSEPFYDFSIGLTKKYKDTFFVANLIPYILAVENFSPKSIVEG